MRTVHEVRHEPNGHRIRVFTYWVFPDTDKVDVRISWGTSNPDTVAECIRKYGQLETSRILTNQERWYYRLHKDDLPVRQRTWRNACKRDGLISAFGWEDR